MSIARTYYLARRARSKLSAEAARHNHDLRLLVGHANLLDSLMIHLAEAERDQEEWFNEAIRGNMMNEDEEEEYEEESRDWPAPQEETQEWLAADYESDSESEEEEDEDEDEGEMEVAEYNLSTPRKPVHPSLYYQTVIGVSEVEEDFEEDEDEEDEDGLYTLTRTVSHRPPQLVADMSDDEDEDSNPPSPPQVTLTSFSRRDQASLKPSYFNQHPHHPPPINTNNSEPYYGNYYRSTPMIDSY